MSVTSGPRRGLIINALTGDGFDVAFRTFLRAIDALLMCNVLSKTLAAPPGSPANGAAYIVAASPTGAWAGHANAVAVWTTDNPLAGGGEWEFYPAANGFFVFNLADATLYFWNATAWTPVAGGGGSSTLAGDSDVTVTSPTTGQVLQWNGSKWINATPSGGGGGSSTLAGDTDVLISSPANNDVLTYETSSTLWKNKPASGGGGGGTSIYPALTPPVSSNFTWNNPNAYAEVTLDKTGRMIITFPHGSLGLALMSNTALPSTPYTIDVAMLAVCDTNALILHLALVDVSGNIQSYGMQCNSSVWEISSQSWSAPATPVAASWSKVWPGMDTGTSLTFVRITDDGTNRKIYWSKNGVDYYLAQTEATGFGVTPVNVGMEFYSNSSVNPATVMLYHWAVTPSILPQNA